MPESKHRRKGKNRPRQQATSEAVQMGGAELHLAVVRQMYEQKVLEVNQLQARVNALVQTVVALLLTKKGRRAEISPKAAEAVSQYQGYEASEKEDGTIVLSLRKGDKRNEDST